MGFPSRGPLRALHLAGTLAATVLVAACSDEAVAPDPALQDLVGNWDAVRFEVTSVEDPDVSVDLVELGATYFINIQPSGGYTSTLTFQGSACTELGELSVRGEGLRFHVQTSTCSPPRTDSSTFEVDGDLLTIRGETVFDFDLSGSPDEARLDARLDRR